MKVKIKNTAKLLSAWLLVGGIFLVLAEIALRLVAPLHLTGGYIGNYKYDEELGYRLKSGYFSNVTDYKQEIYVNQLGSVNFVDDFTKYNHLVFALGDSYTQGTGLPLDSAYPAQLDLLLNMPEEKYEQNYLVVNLGLAAYGGEQSRIVYERFKQNVGQPKVILYFGSSNDEDDDAMFRSGYRHRALVDGSPHYGMLQKPLALLTHGTELGKRINYVRGVMARKQVGVTILDDSKLPLKSVAEKQQQHFEWLYNEAKKNGILLVVGWANSPDFRADPGAYQWLKAWAENKKVPFADWHSAVESVKESLPALPSSNDHSGGHYRIWVNMIIARAFAKPIKAYIGNQRQVRF